DVETAWAFTVLPAFYERKSFYAVCIAAFVLAVAGLWRLRLKMLQRQFGLVLEERARIAREIHDTALQGMAGVAFELEGVAKGVGAPVDGDIRRIRRQVEEHIQDTRHSIWDLRVSDGQTLPATLSEF